MTLDLDGESYSVPFELLGGLPDSVRGRLPDEPLVMFGREKVRGSAVARTVLKSLEPPSDD